MKPALRLLIGAFATAALFGCNYSNPHGSQELPPVKRLVTEPSGTTVMVERLNLQFEAPCDLPETVYEDDVITVTKPGWISYRGPLRELSQVARGTYRCVLQR